MPVRVVETSPSSSTPRPCSGGTQGNTMPQPCALLSAGQTFSGTQNVSNQQKDEAWRVNVQIQGCDLDHGYLCGTMEALNVPMADTPCQQNKCQTLTPAGFFLQPLLIPERICEDVLIDFIVELPKSNRYDTILVIMVVTFWEGEIVDTKNYTFFTDKWGATTEDDIRHWSQFPSFSPLQSMVENDGGKSLDLSNYQHIFMRWKEQYFVNVGTDCGLTIAGFYYVCFSCNDGSINGFYYDPNSSPFQKLELKTTSNGRSGFSFSSYELQ